MANAEWEKLKETLKKPATPEAMAEAGQAFEKWEKTKPRKSRPTLVSLKYKAPYPTSIELKDIPKELERNPAFFDLMKKVVTKEK